MKKNKNKVGLTAAGFILFLIPIIFTVTCSIFLYKGIVERGLSSILTAVLFIIYILFTSLIFCSLDLIRRKLMVEKPVESILETTEKLKNGNFKARFLKTGKSYGEYGVIMDNLNEMAKSLEKSKILKEDFISNLSHEIKTPVAVIQNYAKALLKKDLPETTKNEYIKTLNQATERLSALVTGILKLYRLENTGALPEKDYFSLSELLRQNVLKFEEQIVAKNIDLYCEISDFDVLANEFLIESIFQNLISNAVKFTSQDGKIEINLKKNKDEVIFTVSDTGVGIKKEDLSRIFDKFYQADLSRSSMGNGIGLSIVKKAIDLIGGRIEIESELEKGSTFKVTFIA